MIYIRDCHVLSVYSMLSYHMRVVHDSSMLEHMLLVHCPQCGMHSACMQVECM